jgi:hypothetical protein
MKVPEQIVFKIRAQDQNQTCSENLIRPQTTQFIFWTMAAVALTNITQTNLN